MKNRALKHRSHLPLLASLPLLLGVLQCGPGTALEQQSLDAGESIILKFDGPYTYEYKSKGNPLVKSHSGTGEEQIALKNHYSDSDPDEDLRETIVAHAAISYDSKLSIYMGPDMTLKNDSGGPVIPEGSDEVYKEKAFITNLKAPDDGQLDMDAPIEFSKNLVGITTIRKEKICVDGSGKTIPSFNNSTVPNLRCPPYSWMKDTGKVLQFDYSVDQLKQLMGTSGQRKNSLIYVWHKGDPLQLTLQNIKEVKVTLSPAVLAAFQQQGPTLHFVPKLPGNNSADSGTGDGSSNSENTSQGNSDGQEATPVDSKIATGNTPEGSAITTVAQAQEGGSKGCSLGLAPSSGYGLGTLLSYLAAFLMPVLGRGFRFRNHR